MSFCGSCGTFISRRDVNHLASFSDDNTAQNHHYCQNCFARLTDILSNLADEEKRVYSIQLSQGILPAEVAAVSGLVAMANDVSADPWKIKKKLTPSDTGELCRLMLGKQAARDHILKFFSKEDEDAVRKRGRTVPVFDIDTEEEHQLMFKFWKSSESYLLNRGWTEHFVRKRNLNVDDKIGLFWDRPRSRLNFSVLGRAIHD